MTESSRPWQDGLGDGGPYSADQWDVVLETLALAQGANVGVVPSLLNELVVTSTGDNNITVDTGRALVEGTVYDSTTSESKTTANPSIGTTGRRVMLRKDWATREVRIAIRSSNDGVLSLPVLIQQDGVGWETPLASFTITTGGVIGALTDEREFTGWIAKAGRFLSRAGQTRYSLPGWVLGPGSTGTMLADRIYLTPILVHEPRTFDRISLNVSTLAAGEVARLGLYNALLAADGLTPGSLLLDAGTVSVATTGDKEVTISQLLAPGWYFTALVVESTTPVFQVIDEALVMACPVVGRWNFVTDNVAMDVVLQTDANAGADWPNNGLPDPAPAVTDVDRAFRSAVTLRDST